MLYWFVIVLFGIILGDLFSGLFHWWEDRYGKTEWPLIGKFVVENNIGHHKTPWTIGNESYWTNCGPAMLALLPFMVIAWYFGYYLLLIAFIVTSQANQVHAWSHKKANPFIRFFQKLGLLLSPRHHAVHHKRPYTQRYCVVTDWLNPVLHATHFWDVLEWLVWITFRVKPNPEREIY